MIFSSIFLHAVTFSHVLHLDVLRRQIELKLKAKIEISLCMAIMQNHPLPSLYIQVNEKICNLEREYRDCIKSRRDKIGITRHIMMHQVLYNVHVTLFIGQLHNI